MTLKKSCVLITRATCFRWKWWPNSMICIAQKNTTTHLFPFSINLRYHLPYLSSLVRCSFIVPHFHLKPHIFTQILFNFPSHDTNITYLWEDPHHVHSAPSMQSAGNIWCLNHSLHYWHNKWPPIGCNQWYWHCVGSAGCGCSTKCCGYHDLQSEESQGQFLAWHWQSLHLWIKKHME